MRPLAKKPDQPERRSMVPAGLQELLEGLTIQVLKTQPKNLYTFAAEHFERLLRMRDGDYDCLLVSSDNRNRTAERVYEITPTTSASLKSTGGVVAEKSIQLVNPIIPQSTENVSPVGKKTPEKTIVDDGKKSTEKEHTDEKNESPEKVSTPDKQKNIAEKIVNNEIEESKKSIEKAMMSEIEGNGSPKIAEVQNKEEDGKLKKDIEEDEEIKEVKTDVKSDSIEVKERDDSKDVADNKKNKSPDLSTKNETPETKDVDKSEIHFKKSEELEDPILSAVKNLQQELLISNNNIYDLNYKEDVIHIPLHGENELITQKIIEFVKEENGNIIPIDSNMKLQMISQNNIAEKEIAIKNEMVSGTTQDINNSEDIKEILNHNESITEQETSSMQYPVNENDTTDKLQKLEKDISNASNVEDKIDALSGVDIESKIESSDVQSNNTSINNENKVTGGTDEETCIDVIVTEDDTVTIENEELKEENILSSVKDENVKFNEDVKNYNLSDLNKEEIILCNDKPNENNTKSELEIEPIEAHVVNEEKSIENNDEEKNRTIESPNIDKNDNGIISGENTNADSNQSENQTTKEEIKFVVNDIEKTEDIIIIANKENADAEDKNIVKENKEEIENIITTESISDLKSENNEKLIQQRGSPEEKNNINQNDDNDENVQNKDSHVKTEEIDETKEDETILEHGHIGNKKEENETDVKEEKLNGDGELGNGNKIVDSDETKEKSKNEEDHKKDTETKSHDDKTKTNGEESKQEESGKVDRDGTAQLQGIIVAPINEELNEKEDTKTAVSDTDNSNNDEPDKKSTIVDEKHGKEDESEYEEHVIKDELEKDRKSVVAGEQNGEEKQSGNEEGKSPENEEHVIKDIDAYSKRMECDELEEDRKSAIVDEQNGEEKEPENEEHVIQDINAYSKKMECDELEEDRKSTVTDEQNGEEKGPENEEHVIQDINAYSKRMECDELEEDRKSAVADEENSKEKEPENEEHVIQDINAYSKKMECDELEEDRKSTVAEEQNGEEEEPENEEHIIQDINAYSKKMECDELDEDRKSEVAVKQNSKDKEPEHEDHVIQDINAYSKKMECDELEEDRKPVVINEENNKKEDNDDDDVMQENVEATSDVLDKEISSTIEEYTTDKNDLEKNICNENMKIIDEVIVTNINKDVKSEVLQKENTITKSEDRTDSMEEDETHIDNQSNIIKSEIETSEGIKNAHIQDKESIEKIENTIENKVAVTDSEKIGFIKSETPNEENIREVNGSILNIAQTNVNKDSKEGNAKDDDKNKIIDEINKESVLLATNLTDDLKEQVLENFDKEDEINKQGNKDNVMNEVTEEITKSVYNNLGNDVSSNETDKNTTEKSSLESTHINKIVEGDILEDNTKKNGEIDIKKENDVLVVEDNNNNTETDNVIVNDTEICDSKINEDENKTKGNVENSEIELVVENPIVSVNEDSSTINMKENTIIVDNKSDDTNSIQNEIKGTDSPKQSPVDKVKDTEIATSSTISDTEKVVEQENNTGNSENIISDQHNANKEDKKKRLQRGLTITLKTDSESIDSKTDESEKCSENNSVVKEIEKLGVSTSESIDGSYATQFGKERRDTVKESLISNNKIKIEERIDDCSPVEGSEEKSDSIKNDQINILTDELEKSNVEVKDNIANEIKSSDVKDEDKVETKLENPDVAELGISDNKVALVSANSGEAESNKNSINDNLVYFNNKVRGKRSVDEIHNIKNKLIMKSEDITSFMDDEKNKMSNIGRSHSLNVTEKEKDSYKKDAIVKNVSVTNEDYDEDERDLYIPDEKDILARISIGSVYRSPAKRVNKMERQINVRLSNDDDNLDSTVEKIKAVGDMKDIENNNSLALQENTDEKVISTDITNQKENNAAIIIQTIWRKFNKGKNDKEQSKTPNENDAKTSCLEDDEAARIIQREYRNFMAKKSTVKGNIASSKNEIEIKTDTKVIKDDIKIKAAHKIQALWRKFLRKRKGSSKNIEKQNSETTKQENAARVIQKQFRNFLGRNVDPRDVPKATSNSSGAVTLTSAIGTSPEVSAAVASDVTSERVLDQIETNNSRSPNFGPMKHSTLKKARSMPEDSLNDVSIAANSAATKIQAGFRGYQVRKKISQGKKQSPISKKKIISSGKQDISVQSRPSSAPDLELLEKSATKIQANVRGFLTRKKTQKNIRNE